MKKKITLLHPQFYSTFYLATFKELFWENSVFWCGKTQQIPKSEE